MFSLVRDLTLAAPCTACLSTDTELLLSTGALSASPGYESQAKTGVGGQNSAQVQGHALAEPGRGSEASEPALIVSPCLMPEQAAPEQATLIVELAATTAVIT